MRTRGLIIRKPIMLLAEQAILIERKSDNFRTARCINEIVILCQT